MPNGYHPQDTRFQRRPYGPMEAPRPKQRKKRHDSLKVARPKQRKAEHIWKREKPRAQKIKKQGAHYQPIGGRKGVEQMISKQSTQNLQWKLEDCLRKLNDEKSKVRHLQQYQHGSTETTTRHHYYPQPQYAQHQYRQHDRHYGHPARRRGGRRRTKRRRRRRRCVSRRKR